MTQPGRKFTAAQRREKRALAWQMRQAGMTQMDIANELDVSQTTICYWLRAYAQEFPQVTPQQKAAYRIRAELVCCDIYARMEAAYDPEDEDDAAYQALRHSSDYHPICFYGEWAARIAEKVA